MILNHRGSRRIGKVRGGLRLRSIGVVTLVLEERLAYLFLIVNASGVRVELGVVGCVPVRLQVLGVSGGGPSVYRRRLTRGSM